MDISWHFLTNVQHTMTGRKAGGKYDVSTTGTGAAVANIHYRMVLAGPMA
ncbi:hypothetical protein BANRA_05375 [Escherichia coli]|nr:hypothetical protein BANRA_05375 [Escherichia coli]